jgi:coproporphyrinogen III oxidase-like Fe-S oxidoreductase
MKYMTDMETGNDVTVFSETLTQEQIYLEQIMLGLRRSDGIAIDDLMNPLSNERKETMAQTIDLLRTHNFLQKRVDRIILTAAGLSIQNDIAARLSL